MGLAFLGLTDEASILPTLDTASRSRAFVRSRSRAGHHGHRHRLSLTRIESLPARRRRSFRRTGITSRLCVSTTTFIESVALGFRVDPLFFTASLIAALYVIGIPRIP